MNEPAVVEYLKQFATDTYMLEIDESEKVEGKQVYLIINNYTGVVEAETSILPEAIKVVTDWTKMLELPSEILTPPKQDIITKASQK